MSDQYGAPYERGTTLKVRRQRCGSCIYKRESPFDVRKLEETARERRTARICHHTEDAVCRGFFNRHREQFERLNMVEVDDDLCPEIKTLRGSRVDIDGQRLIRRRDWKFSHETNRFELPEGASV